MIGNSTIGALIGYVYDCWTSGLEEGDFYKKSLSELQAYAVGSTIQHLLDNDPIFRDAVKNGTTGQLPDACDRTPQPL